MSSESIDTILRFAKLLPIELQWVFAILIVIMCTSVLAEFLKFFTEDTVPTEVNFSFNFKRGPNDSAPAKSETDLPKD